ATDANGDLITVRHVDSAAAGGGDGSILAPVNSLADASNQPEHIVFVHGGSVFDGESFATNTAGQRVLGEGVPHSVLTQAGWVDLPSVNGGPAPVVQNSVGNAFTLGASGVELAGFDIRTPGGSGVFASGVGDINVNRNTVDGAAGAGFEFQNLTGSNIVSGNTATGHTGAGSDFTGPADVPPTNNV